MDLRRLSDSETGFFYGYLIVISACVIMFMMWGVHYAFGVFFKPLLAEFGWTRAMTSGAYSLCLIISGLLAVAMGGLTDRLGPRFVMTFCGIFLGLGFFLMSKISAIWQFYLFYGIIVGIGMGGSFIPLISTVARWFVRRRSIMTGIVAASTGAGALIGPPVANLLISRISWREAYFLLGCIVFAIMVLAAQILRRDPSQIGQRAYGEVPRGNNTVHVSRTGFSLKQALGTGRFWIFFITGFSYGYCVFSIMVHIAPHTIELGFSSTRAANILAIIGGASIVGKILMGRFGDVFENRQALMISFILMSAALFWFLMAESPWILYVIAGLFGFAYGGCAVSHSPLLAVLFGLRAHGLIFGVFGTSVAIGGAMGPFMTGYVFDITGSYRLAFLFCCVISSLGIVLTAILSPKKSSVTD